MTLTTNNGAKYDAAMPSGLSAHDGGAWSLQAFVDVANALLPDYLPKDASSRAGDEVNPRLVRHYTTIGLLPEPLKEGREARYLFEHLQSLLVVRKLLAEGFSTAAIGQVLKGRARDDLQALLDGAVRLELVPGAATDPRLAFLRGLRQKAGLDVSAPLGLIDNPVSMPPYLAPYGAPEPSRAPSRTPAAWSAPELFEDVAWSRIALLDGLELHVRHDFTLPATRLGDDQIAQLVKTVLLHLEQTRKGKR
jgi:DNA-binding transcriptional MerR regulator